MSGANAERDPAGALAAIRDGSTVIALVGNPNVGKSTLFNRLTGLGVETAHYPGTTQDVSLGATLSGDTRVVVADLPGTYTLADDVTAGQLTRRALLDLSPDVIALVLDATNLERNLFLALQVAALGTPFVVAVNLVDEAGRHGLELDTESLSAALGASVVATVATTGAGTDELVRRALDVAGAAVPDAAQHFLPVDARDLHERARAIATRTVAEGAGARRGGRDAWTITTGPWTGVPIALLVLATVFTFLFVVGDVLASAFAWAWQGYVSPVISRVIEALAGTGTVAAVLHWGFDAGIEASLSIGLPYILTFYVLIAVLEDSGYLSSLAFLADRVMHRVGLHGRAILPLVAAAGCNVPAMVALRQLPSRRERFIASVLIALVPCSARTAVVLGAVGHYIGWQPALGVFAVVGVLAAASGLALNRIVPGTSPGLVMEMFPYRRPRLSGVMSKAWSQFREFLFVATPIVIAGSLVLGALYETGWLWRLTGPLEPVVVGWLGLPSVAGLTLLLGTLRKELALQLLVAMAVASMGAAAANLTSFMTPTNLFVYALVNTIAVPCVSTLAVLARQQGWLRTAAIVLFTLVAAIVMGGTFARLLPLLGWA